MVTQSQGDAMTGFWKFLVPPPRVLFASSEFGPLIKTGGLADVSASLPAALAELGCDIRVAIPGYGAVLAQVRDGRTLARMRFGPYDVQFVETERDGVPVVLVCCPTLFARNGDPYLGPDGTDWSDNADRFALFARALVWLATVGPATVRPNILHLNDWQTGLAAPLLEPLGERPLRVFSIHNLAYQGVYDRATFERLTLPDALWSYRGLEFHGRMSFIKGGIAFADALTTVSPTYAREIQTAEYGAGLEGLLQHRRADLHGIVNGIDTAVWNPASDPLIAAHYDSDDLDRKRLNKSALQQELGLAPGPQPLLGIVSRLAQQKGMDLVLEALPALLEAGCQIAALGAGDSGLQQSLRAAAAAHPGQVAFAEGRNERLAHMIEAGADIFLMPSRYEPCGLNQMYSMRYGTVPVARRTGGLADTIVPVSKGLAHGTGFLFDDPTAAALTSTVRAALRLFRNADAWRRVQLNGMVRDFSWHASAERYLSLYRNLLTAREMRAHAAASHTDGRSAD
jgi:starch synthase